MELPAVSTLHGLFAQARAEPAAITLFRDWTRLTTDEHGEMQGGALQGFFAAETQLMTHYELRVNGCPISHRLSTQLSASEWSSVGAVLASGDSGDLAEGTLPKGSIELRMLRRVEQGWSELVMLRNNGQPRREVQFQLRFCCPIRAREFVDEMQRERKLPWTGLVPKAAEAADRIALHFHKDFGARGRAPTRELAAMYGDRAPVDGEHITRSLTVTARVLPASAHARLHVRAGRICVLEAQAELGAREEVRLLVTYEPDVNGLCLAAPDLAGLAPLPRKTPVDLADSVRVISSNATLDLVIGQAIADLRSLTLPIFGPSVVDPARHRAYNAGIPRYIGLFGRDNVVTVQQSPLFGTDSIEPVLARLGLLQGLEREDWRDEEPGRLVHERRMDPRSQLGVSNRELYYGDVTATPFWILALSSLYQWTGDRDVLVRQRSTLERCCDWITRRLDQGDGFIYYAPALPGSANQNRNQAWKDSGDAIVDGLGHVRVPPLALPEVQGYAYQALGETARILRILDGTGADARHDQLMSRARTLKTRFNERFWLAGSQFYALALDRDEQPLDARASNIGHCLVTGIIDDDKIAHVVRALMSDDLFSGWGIRTLSAHNPAYDPFSYHRGAVWPVENAFIATGMRRHGYHAEAERITTAQLAVAALFEHMRLPEVMSGHHRTASDPSPGIYSFANPLQAWSVSAIARHVQSMLGLWPRAGDGVLNLDPHLPPWLDWIEVHHVAVGAERIALRLWRESDGRTVWAPIGPPPAIELRAGPPPIATY